MRGHGQAFRVRRALGVPRVVSVLRGVGAPRVRCVPCALRVLPAHGPVAPSTHARVDELLAHHDTRLEQCRAALAAGPATAHDVAGHLGWTRHEHRYDSLDPFSRGMAAMETKAHLDLLVARGEARDEPRADGVRYTLLPR